MTIGHEPTFLDKTLFAMVIGALVLLGIAMAQPIWNADHLLEDFRTSCDKRGGVQLEHKGMFGITYECASRLD